MKERYLAHTQQLMLAAINGNTEEVGKLLSEVDINARDAEGKTALIHAAENERVDLVDDLIKDASIDVNAQDHKGKTALMHAAAKGNIAIVDLLKYLEKCDIKMQDREGKTALTHAVINRRMDIVRCLFVTSEFGSPRSQSFLRRLSGLLFITDGKGVTASMYAARNGDLEMVNLLMGAHIGSGRETVDGEVLDEFGPDIRRTDTCGLTILMHAIVGGNVDVVRRLIYVYGADVNARDVRGKTALMYAAEKEDVALARCLFNNHRWEIDVNDTSHDGETALMLAVRKNDKPMIQYLHLSGADFDIQDEYYKTAFEETFPDNFDLMRFLLDDLHINVRQRDIQTALGHAAADGNEEMVDYFIDTWHAAVNILDTNDRTVLMRAIEGAQEAMVRYLITEHDADVNARTSCGITPLMLSYKCAPPLMKYLIECGADLDLQDDYKRTAWDFRLSGSAEQMINITKFDSPPKVVKNDVFNKDDEDYLLSAVLAVTKQVALQATPLQGSGWDASELKSWKAAVTQLRQPAERGITLLSSGQKRPYDPLAR